MFVIPQFKKNLNFMKNFILLLVFTFSIGFLPAQSHSVNSDKKSKILIHHYESIIKNNGRFYLSGNSSKARGMTEADIKGKPAEFALPTVLLRLSLESDRMFTY